MRKWLFALIVLVGFMQGCKQTTRTIGSGEVPQNGMISKEELRDKLDRFEYFFISNMKQTAEDINAGSSTRRIQRTTIQMQSRCIEALHAMMASDDSVVAFLDTWGLMIRLQYYLQEGSGQSLFGDQQQLALNFIENSEKDIERIARLFLSQDQFEETLKNIGTFASQNPIQGNFSNLVVYATKIRKEEPNMFMKTIGIPMAPIRAIEGVDKTGDAILKIRDSVERFTDVTEQLPESTRWQMSILLDDFEDSELAGSFLKSLDDFSQSSTQLVDTLNAMPQEIRQELVAFLKESEETQPQLQTTMQNAAQAATAWQNASDSIQELVKLFKSDTPRDPNAPPAFGMRDFDAMLIHAGQTADKVNQAVTQLQRTMESDTKENVQQQVRSLIDHIAWRLFELMVAVAVLMLVYRFLKRKLYPSG